MSWNGSGGAWWADRGIFITSEAVGEIITNSDLQNFGLEAVGKWVIFCYFSTGRKYPAVVYDSYIGGLINHIELITWGKQLLKTMNIPKGATIDGTSNGIALLVGG